LQHAKTVVQPPPHKIIWCYGVYQAAFDGARVDGSAEFREGLPDPESFDGRQRTLLVIDDLMAETETDHSFDNLHDEAAFQQLLADAGLPPLS